MIWLPEVKMSKHFLLNKWFIIKQPGDGRVILFMILDIKPKVALSIIFRKFTNL